MEFWPGNPYPLGATWDGAGVNFALFSENATAVELCLFDFPPGAGELRIPLTEKDNFIWHIYLPGLTPGQCYGYRVSGPYDPENGQRFNPYKLLLDPYAKAIDGTVVWNNALFGYTIGDPNQDVSFNADDSAPFMPKSVVIDPHFDWGNDARPMTPWHETTIYELHVKGFTRLCSEVPEPLRGTYSGLACPPVLNYLKSLGITAVELMPVHQSVSEQFLAERGLSNYWGYNTIGYFTPDARFASGGKTGDQVIEFKQMVKAFHHEGIEVILDVVYNHTAEGNQLGPTLCFRGVDNSAYYRLAPERRRYYMDYTGTGNTLNMLHPQVLQLMMDSLRYWVTEMHVDGFRFDLASALARELHDVDRLSAFFDVIHQDPVISQVKLIAEPWDVGEGGYQVGNFPPGWAEWNGKFRDTMRDFWRGAEVPLAEFANRLAGSPDLYSDDGRLPTASINFITCHDGFTLTDLVSYNEKHNEANGEDNRDGESYNRSWNSGVEGPTADPAILALRDRRKRDFLATLFLSQGVSMLLAGDELGRTQGGNNNAYNQDNPVSWVDWEHADPQLQAFTRYLIHQVASHPVFCRRRWFIGRPVHGAEAMDIAWYWPSGAEVSEEDWKESNAKALAVFLNGSRIAATDRHGHPVRDDSFFLIFNAYLDAQDFLLPQIEALSGWIPVLDTTVADGQPAHAIYRPGDAISIPGQSMLVLKNV